jgi:hypothetical protein
VKFTLAKEAELAQLGSDGGGQTRCRGPASPHGNRSLSHVDHASTNMEQLQSKYKVRKAR